MVEKGQQGIQGIQGIPGPSVSQEEHQEVLNRFKAYRNKALMGYVILLLGLGYAVHGNSEAIRQSKSRGAVVRGIICTINKESDEESVRQLPVTSKLLHIDIAILEKYEKKNLVKQAGYRKKLQPSVPASACSSTPVPIR